MMISHCPISEELMNMGVDNKAKEREKKKTKKKQKHNDYDICVLFLFMRNYIDVVK